MKMHIGTVLIVIIFFASCKQHNDNTELSMLVQGFINANKHVEQSNFYLYRELDQNLADPILSPNSIKWFAKSKTIKKYTADIIREVDLQLEKNTLQAESTHQDLYNKLFDYKRNLIDVVYPVQPIENTTINRQLNEYKRKLYDEIPVLALYTRKQQLDSLLSNSNPLMQKTLLHKIKNDVLLSENMLLHNILSRVCIIARHYEEFGIMAAINSSYVKAGDTLELSAGIGRFNGDASPRITVNDREIEMNGYGHTTHFFEAKGKPGKYTLAVKFELVRPDGTKASLIKNINYVIIP